MKKCKKEKPAVFEYIDCVSAYFHDRYKNNIRSQFCSSFRTYNLIFNQQQSIFNKYRKPNHLCTAASLIVLTTRR